MGIKNAVKRIGDKAGGTVSKLASLSSEELEKIESKRNEYLLQMPNPEDEISLELTGRLLAASSVEIYNAYLPQISQLYSPVKNEVEYDGPFSAGHNIRYINITKWVTNKEENNLEKLINVYQVLSNDECNIALVFNRKKSKTNVYLAITNTLNEETNTDIDRYKTRISDAIRGNFPGSEFNDDGVGIIPCLDNDYPYSVAIASNVPAEKSEKFISQTIEKLLDGIIPNNSKEEYTIILLATPILDIESRKMQLSEFYTALSPYASWQTDYHFTDAEAFGSSATIGVNVGASAGIQKGTNQSLTDSDAVTDQSSQTETTTQTEGISESTSNTKGSSDTVGGSIFGSAGGQVGLFGTGAKFQAGASADYHHGWNRSKTKTKGTNSSTAKGIANTLGKAVTKSVAKTAGSSLSHSLGANFGANFARTSSVTATISKNEGISQSHINYSVKHTLELLEKQMKRYEQSVALGMWDFAAYVLSEDDNIANNVAHTYIALTQGEDSYMNQASINLWRGDLGDNSLDTKEICSYLRELRHPMFGLNPAIVTLDSTFNVYPSVITATTALSGKELAYSLNFPRKSVAGLPVLECTEFGRNISSYEKSEEANINIGNIFHMNHEENTEVLLDVNSLSSHVFITGSTGTGKSNTVYKLLRELRRKEVKFLVIEPVKGEYKNVFGKRRDVFVYGTNPKKTDLIKINPFSFPNDIHVLEHIDRLIEIFNVCWPMYAAMPAVLKNAIERSYEDCGWNLTKSTNKYGEEYYPCFNDVCRNIKEIINSSEYDDENKGAYKGALLTRLESLSNGINGLILSRDEIPAEKLFDENAIVDLSRIGSTETKSLLMGLIVLKLQEYRLSTASEMNAPLKHVTVLEEAHNILKKAQANSGESSSLIGKSVEMISNSIAEMRTYGEGFFIVDQAPGLLDESVIRNTNTKIIMRLPHQIDRELVGTAANLSVNQIQELARLPKGAAAVYQNNWIQPILCKVKKVNTEDSLYSYEPVEIVDEYCNYDTNLIIAGMISKGVCIGKEVKLEDLKIMMKDINIEDSAKATIIKLLSSSTDKVRMTKIAPIMSALFKPAYEEFKEIYEDSHEPKEWTMRINQYLVNTLNLQMDAQVRRDIIQGIVTQYLLFEVNKPKVLEDWRNRGNLR